MKLTEKLTNRAYRWAFIQFVSSLLLAAVLFSLFLSAWKFVQLGQELSEKFKRSHSHVYDDTAPKEIPYYGCQCVETKGITICHGCVDGSFSHIVMDTPEITFQRCTKSMLLEVCPSYATDHTSLFAIICHRWVETGMRLVIYSQERILSASFIIISMLLYFVYLYFVVYRYFHHWIDIDKAIQFEANKLKLTNPAHATKKYNNPVYFERKDTELVEMKQRRTGNTNSQAN
jgi:hypothetical protein